MLLKHVIAWLIATAFVAATTLTPIGALAAGRGGANIPMPGTYNWPPCAPPTVCPGTEGPRCGYVRVHPNHQKQGKAQWVYQCH